MLTNTELTRIKEQTSSEDVIRLLQEVERLQKYVKDYSAMVNEKVDEIEADMLKLEAENKRLIAVRESAFVERDACVGLIAKLALACNFNCGTVSDNYVVVDLPSGQVSWDYTEEEAHLFEGLPKYNGAVEDVSIQEKYRRVMNSGV